MILILKSKFKFVWVKEELNKNQVFNEKFNVIKKKVKN